MQWDLLTSSPAASPASLGATPASAAADTTSATSGPHSSPSPSAQRRAVFSSRMSLASLRILAELTGSRPTLKRADTSGGRAVSVLRTSAHRTCETDSGSALWPTATAQDHCSRNSRLDGTPYSPGSSYSHTLNDAVALIEPWATPTAGLHNEQEDPASFQARSVRLLAAGSRPLGANLGQQAQTVPHPWATPNTIDARGGSRTGQGQVQLCHQVLGPTPLPSPAATARPGSSQTPALRLSWRFSAWLMGLPPHWLTGGHWLPQSRGGPRASAPSATPSCRSRPTSLPGRSSR